MRSSARTVPQLQDRRGASIRGVVVLCYVADVTVLCYLRLSRVLIPGIGVYTAKEHGLSLLIRKPLAALKILTLTNRALCLCTHMLQVYPNDAGPSIYQVPCQDGLPRFLQDASVQSGNCLSQDGCQGPQDGTIPLTELPLHLEKWCDATYRLEENATCLYVRSPLTISKPRVRKKNM